MNSFLMKLLTLCRLTQGSCNCYCYKKFLAHYVYTDLIADDGKNALVNQSLVVVYISKSTVNDYCFNLLCIAYIFYGIYRKNDHISLLFSLYRAYYIINT